MRPRALVYRGPAARPTACSDAVAALLRSSARGFDVRFVGDREEDGLTPATLARAALYAQPGGGELGPAYRRLRRYRDTLRAYVAGGGRYLGFCLGGSLAGATPRFEDGPVFLLAPGARDVTVLARYSGGGIAALTAPFGAGCVGVVGPHPEATSDWYRDAGLRTPHDQPADLGHDLIDQVMQ